MKTENESNSDHALTLCIALRLSSLPSCPLGSYWVVWNQGARCLIISSVFWFGLILSAHGRSSEIPITTNNLDQIRHVFAISTKPASNGITFHVTITAKREGIPSDSEVALSIVTRTKEGRESTWSLENVKPAVHIALKRETRVWTANFTVSHNLLRNPGLCFVFTEYAHSIIDGKSVVRPSADYHEIQLKDFLN